MIRKGQFWGGQFALLSCALLAGCSSSPPSGSLDAMGAMSMNLTIAPGITLSSLNWVIRDASQATVVSSQDNGRHPWSGGAAQTIRLAIGGIPKGGPYTIELTGTASTNDTCQGISDAFSVGNGRGTVSVNVNCAVPGAGTAANVTTGAISVEGTVTTTTGAALLCPGIGAYSVSPSTISSQGVAQLSVDSLGPVPQGIHWTSTAGLIATPNAAQTDFQCNGHQGDVTVTVTLEGPLSCVGQPYMIQTEIITCEAPLSGDGSFSFRGLPNTACSKDADCESYSCVNSACSTYAATCQELSTRNAPPGVYQLDTDATGPNPPFSTYCQTGSVNLPPTGLCQAESGAPPACRSFVGAVGYDFVGVDFGGVMAEGGSVERQAQPINGVRDVIELKDGTVFTNAFSSWCCYGSASTPYRYPVVGQAKTFGTGIGDGYGVIELYDRRILFGGGTQVAAISLDENIQIALRSTASFWPIQAQSGRIVMPSRSINGLIEITPEGLAVADTSSPIFLIGNVDSALQLSDGTLVVGVAGANSNTRLAFFERDMMPRRFATAPRGMTLNSDGSLSRPDLVGVGGMLQLPNGQFLVTSVASNTILRLAADGAYVDTFTLPTAWSNPTGLTLDHHGRLLVTVESTHQIQVVTFPGCSDGTRNGSETDVDCGGQCTRRCVASQTCQSNADCSSAQCRNGVCQ